MEESVVDLRELPEKVFINLRHSRQRYDWDCGIACVLMVLTEADRESFTRDFVSVCKDEGFHRSTWTIDLCYLLRRYNVDHNFYTVTIGIHPGYHSNAFYRTVLAKDEQRINSRFGEAKMYGINVHEGSVEIVTILRHLRLNGPAIVLTNARLLTCDLCKLNKVSLELRQCLPWPAGYQGHYIVLCGYNKSRRKVYYRNPSFHNRVCVMSIDALEDARKSYGTDEDLILIDL
ncbi:hypothetical protein PPYR_03365 [Photinus pyralis]|uniref:Protein GUCD1 n=1 Tax=Photinus pyralis TaxID=7054 RepID=A0A5N4A2L4_PHOPY|nr:protein GUCD1 [Photinus pyralis]XP_031331555.1 protein GUCD1 [Photinus pyralis]XP_031331556.1 protein GUCD1 [Photinus pyralis]XP_031331557.1 protein GUCD1 [Photinus pyralis]KAB0791565.1 hypothetical protein PPYR_03365 [Photinus pyralis]